MIWVCFGAILSLIWDVCNAFGFFGWFLCHFLSSHFLFGGHIRFLWGGVLGMGFH